MTVTRARAMAVSIESRLWQWGGNLFPAYRSTRARITCVESEYHEVQIKIPGNWKAGSPIGISRGGGLYSGLDLIYGVMLYKILGRRYQVIDRTASIQIKQPGTTTLIGKFRLSQP